VIEGCPYVDRIIPFELKTIHAYSKRTERGKLAGNLHYFNMIRKEQYDAVFVLKRSLSSALLVWLARVPRRIGFATEGRGPLLTDPVNYRQDQHEVQNFLDCLRVLDIPVGSDRLELWTTPEEDSKAKGLLFHAGSKKDDLKIIIHAAASLTAKQWPLDRFAQVMRILQERFQARFVYTGSKEDSRLYKEIEQQGPFNGLNLCGITSVRENIALYRECDLFFGVDSGPMHMAAAVGVPVVALFGPTDERKWGPWGIGHVIVSKFLDCHPCKPHKCTDNECMKQISVADALKAVESKIADVIEEETGLA
jgi:heptosyltransferase-2